ncbi:hypothetical protein SDC9_150518 [bioreactor metagenome]|uniref:Uncharacterized protein n=1 Tax=bioreactor metagenome TaxID=1076179 RepID=A0A645EMQ9_9ZZZZ
MNATIRTATMIIAAKMRIVYPLYSENCATKALPIVGIAETMFTKRSIEIPCPMPFSVSLSETHMTSTAPAVWHIMITMQAKKPGFVIASIFELLRVA